VQAVIAKRFHYSPPSASATRPTVPPGVSHTIERLLERDPTARISSGALVVAALRQHDTSPMARTPRHAEQSVAVLPFPSLRAHVDDDYFADGITEEIINLLAQIQGLRVAARTSCFAFKGRNEDLRMVGEKLGV